MDQTNQGFNNSPSPYTDEMLQQNNAPVAQDIRQSLIADDYAADVNSLIQKKGSYHCRSLFSTIILFGGVITILALSLTNTIELTTGALIGICVGIYVFYLMLGLICNPLFSYLNNIEHGMNFQKQYENTRALVGHFSFYAECYHYQTRHHTRTVRDANGNNRTQHYTTQEKVVTHRATQILNPKDCVDDSGQADQVRAQTEIIFVHNKVSYRFRDDYSRGRFEYEWNSFRNRHRRDVHQSYTQNFVLPGLKARMCFYVGEKPQNYSCLLVLFSLFGFIWPYSMYIQNKVSRFDINYMKILTMM